MRITHAVPVAEEVFTLAAEGLEPLRTDDRLSHRAGAAAGFSIWPCSSQSSLRLNQRFCARRREIAYGPSPCLSLSGTDAFGTTAGARPGYAGSAASIGLAHVGDLRARRLLNGMTSLSWSSVLKYLLTEVKPPRSQGDLRVQRVDWSAVSVGWAAGLGAA